MRYAEAHSYTSQHHDSNSVLVLLVLLYNSNPTAVTGTYIFICPPACRHKDLRSSTPFDPGRHSVVLQCARNAVLVGVVVRGLE